MGRFFQTAHLLSEAEVDLLSSEPVKRACKRARISNLPELVKAAYLDEELKFNQYAGSVKISREDSAAASAKLRE